MQYFLFAFLITKLFQVNDNILYIPKKYNIYVEIPNGPQKFLDDFPILKIFRRINISLENQEPLDKPNENKIKEVILSSAPTKNEENQKRLIEKLNSKEKTMTFIEKKLYMNIIYYLSSKKEEAKNYYEKVKDKIQNLTKCVYSERLRESKKEYKSILDFLDFRDEEALGIQDDVPLIFKTKDGYEEITIKDDDIKNKDLEYYLNNLKKIMSLEQSIDVIKEWIGKYAITKDNYKKMVLILFKIFANIPVILMGETGCGKTELIKQLMKMLNNGDPNFLITKNMHSGVKESEIVEVIDEAEKKLKESKTHMVCVFFDEINTTSLLSKMKEIFVNHSLNGKEIDEKIRFIGACNPFRKREDKETDNGLKLEKMNEGKEDMAYLVNPLPNSMLYYIFYFKSLDNDDVKTYIESIIGKEFPPGDKDESENSILRNVAIDVIYDSHNFVREKNGKSSVSLRDLQRFRRAYIFFNKYFENKIDFMKERDNKVYYTEIQSKIHSFVLSLFITYYIRIFIKTYAYDYSTKVNTSILNLAKKFNIVDWTNNAHFNKYPFLELVKYEEDFLLEQMEVSKIKGIGLNNSLKENIFLMFFSIYSHIPLIVVGKPGCSKSLSIQLIIRIMRGEFSESKFLQKYPTINSTSFQGSETNTPENIEKIFEVAENKISNSKANKEDDKSEIKMISLLVFDELGLSEKSPTNCLKVLHSKLEMSLNPKEQSRQISFIGISNWGLDAAKMNRTIFLAIPDIGLDDIGITVQAIAKSYDDSMATFKKYETNYETLEYIYYIYKEGLKKLKESQEKESKESKDSNIINEFIENYHGGRDLYHLVKKFSSEMVKKEMPPDPNRALQISILRNLSGLEIENQSSLKYVLDKEYEKNPSEEHLKIFKNMKNDSISTMELITDNIISKDTRFLLLVSEKSMFDFLINIIKQELEQMNKNASNSSDNQQINYVNYIGSPFKGDKINSSYRTEMIANIEDSVAKGKVIILSNLDQIYSIFYDLFNQNYIIKDNKKYCRISHGENIQKLAFVDENTKFIILVDKDDLRKQKLPFLSRFEKHIITFDSLLDEKDKEKSKKINDIIRKIVTVKNINYNMDNILVNTNEDIINGYVYIYKNKPKNSYKDIIEDKIIPIIPQDIICTLPFSELSKEKKEIDFIKNSYSKNRPKSLEEYIKNKGKENILLVYTFSKIGEAINLSEKESYMERIASEIRNVFKFKQILNEFYDKESKVNYKSLILKFNSENAININFFISYIKHYKENNKITDDNKNFIFTINIQREFDSKNVNKIRTVLIADDEIKQLFIDNINGTELTLKDIEGRNVGDLTRKFLDPKKIIVEGMLKFYGENQNEQIGKCKGIDFNNFIKEFKSYIENNEELITDINRIIFSLIGKAENIVNLIIENKSINQNTIDFLSAISKYLKEGFNKQLENFLKKTENNNFFTTLFMLNVKDNKDSVSTISENQLNNYSFNKRDEQLLKNELLKKIIKEFLHKSKEGLNDKMEDNSINIKLYYKIPGFFNIYRGIKKYIQYRQDEGELRKCEDEQASTLKATLKTNMKDFTNKVYTDLISKPNINKVIEVKTDNENYIEFTEVFLNDYITFYLVKLYNDTNNDFVINDVPHKIILFLLDLKFKDLKEDEQCNIPLQKVVAQILWLEANANYIKEILDLYKIISENIVYDEKDDEHLFKELLNYFSKNDIKYEPKKKHLKKVNIPYYIITIILFKCMIDKKSIERANNKNDNYYSYFKVLETCLKEIQKLDKLLKLDIKELSVLNEFITIYNVYERIGKINNLDMNKLIDNLTKSLELIENNEESKISLLCDNLKDLTEIIKQTLYDSSKNKGIKGDTIYYDLISNILLNEIKRENNLEFKIFILDELLLKDEKLFIQSIQLLKLILDDFVTSDIDKFQGSLKKLSNPKLNLLEVKTNNDWIKETLIYTFEQISMAYIENLEEDNEKSKEKNQKNIMVYLKSFLNNCMNFLEKLYKDPELKDEEDKEKMNINLKKIFAISFTRVYLKIFIDWIKNDKFKNTSDIKDIIKDINGEEFNKFRNIPIFYIYKLLYNMNNKEISIFYDANFIDKFQLDLYKNFNLIKKEQNNKEAAKYILFVEAYNSKDPDFKIFDEEFKLLTIYLENPGDKENELKELIEKYNRLDIFYSVFSAQISSHLSNSAANKDKITLLSNVIHNIFDGKEKLTNIFDLFMDKSKYTKKVINSVTAEILQFSLEYCINSDEISNDYDNLYFPLYSGDSNINSYFPGNDIKECYIYDCYTKIKKYLEEQSPNHGVYICTCNIDQNDKEIYTEFISGTGYHKESGICKYCEQPTGNDGEPNSFYERDSYYRIFKNKKDLEEETKNKKNGNCITLEQFFKDYISDKMENDSKGINISKKSHLDKTNKPIRNQSQIGYRLMNLILYSHLFTNSLSNNNDEIFAANGLTYLDYIVDNWDILNKLLKEKGLNIFVFMNLIFKDLFNYLSKQNQIENYEQLLEIEKEIENIIDNKITKKEKIKDKEVTKYVRFGTFYTKNQNLFRENDPKSKTSIIKENNSPEAYKEDEYPYYKSFLYSDYPDEAFLKARFEKINKEQYPVIDLYLNRKNKGINKKFILFNRFIKSLLNEFSNKISRKAAKKLTLEKTYLYKSNQKLCEEFIKIIIPQNKNISKGYSLEYFLIDSTNEKGKLYKVMYEKYAKTQNDLLNETIQQINAANYDTFECQEINIQETQKKDLLILEFEKKSEFTEILLTNSFREIYNAKSKIKYNNYNEIVIDFDKIEKILEDTFIRNACILKTDEIVEMKYEGEEKNDGISDFNKNIKQLKDLDEKDKIAFVDFYEKNLKTNFDSCLEINEGLKNIIEYINKNYKKINVSNAVNAIITDGGFTYELNKDLKGFLKENKNIIISKLTNLMIYLEKLYFELAIQKKGGDFKVSLADTTKEKIENYYKEKKGQLITKDKLSLTIIRFILNDLMIQKKNNNENRLYEMDDNLFDLLESPFLWEKNVIEDSRFTDEIGEYKKLGIYAKNIYDFYRSISNDSIKKFEEEISDILLKINNDEKEKKIEKRQEERNKKIEAIEKEKEISSPKEEVKDVNEEDIEDVTDF